MLLLSRTWLLLLRSFLVVDCLLPATTVLQATLPRLHIQAPEGGAPLRGLRGNGAPQLRASPRLDFTDEQSFPIACLFRSEERIKRDDRLSTVPVIVVSSLAEREKAAALGADVYLPKPVDRRLVLETLNNLRGHAPIRVVAIDDDEGMRFLVRHCLLAPHFEVREAVNGEEGLALIRSELPDVILLDLLMPDADGYEVLRRLREREDTRKIPIMVVTSAALDADARQRLLEQADGFLPKSDISRDTLTAVLQSLVKRNTGPTDRAAAASQQSI